MTKSFLLSFFLLLSLVIFSQQGDGGLPKTFKEVIDYNKIDKRVFDEPNIAALKIEDSLTDNSGTAPWRFGFNNNTNINISNSGTWINLSNGDRIWQLVVVCKNALTINLTFSQTVIPTGNELYVYNPSKDFILGKFTASHLYNGELGTELVPGEMTIVEYFVPKGSSIGNVNICTVTHGYRTPNEFLLKAFGGSGACNVNVNCPEGAAWTQQRNSVVMLVSGSNGFCTGALINNTLNDGKPYVLTANHCYSNPATWIFRFQWESTSCINPSTSPTFQSLSGAVLRAQGTPSDFCLVEITGGLVNGTVPAAYTPYFSGWDNTETISPSAVCIHHPSGDIKKIAIENNALISTSFGGSPSNSHWGVLSWDLGVTEPGSSGSPLFNQNRRIIGQLHGGASACGASVLSDEYGKVSVSWNPAGSTTSGQLKHWLDPNNTNASFVDGYDPSNAPTITLDAGLSNSAFIQTSLCGSNYIPNVTISNGGSQSVTTAVISYSIDGGTAQNYNWNGSLAQFQTQVINLPPVQLLPGNHTFSATVSQVNNGVDELSVNNATNTQFLVTAINQTSNLLKVTLLTDNYSSETYMEVLSSNGTVVWFQGNESFAGTYGTNNTPGPTDPTSPLLDNTTYNWDVPLSLNDCYTFKIYDYYGDGLSGFIADGSLSLANHNNINFYTLSTPNFGAELGIVFKNISTIGLVESENHELNVFPNPANDLLFIYLPSSAKQISIVDIYGKLIYSEPALFESHELKISSLATGTYWLKVDLTNGRTALKRFIKQ
jgi:lysyl endopeptidase